MAAIICLGIVVRELAGAPTRYVQQINALTEVAMAGDGPEFAAQYSAG